MSEPAAFYCLSDRRFFLGLIGLVNSLRLVGHTEPIYVLDCGLTEEQRRLLGAEVRIIPAPDDSPPYMLKTVAPLAHPAETMVLIDADMIVTRPLDELLRFAAEGRVVAVANDTDRFVEGWGRLLGLGPTRRGAYANSGLIVVAGELGRDLLEQIEAGLRRVDFDLTFYGVNDPAYPFRFPEQDVLNAILHSRLAPGQVEVLEARLAATPPFAGVRVLDEGTLRCAYADGVEPCVLHHHVVKPWLEPTYDGAYSRLLRRCLVGPDLAVRVPERILPRRFRSGAFAHAERRLVDARWLVRSRLTRKA